MTGKKPKKLTEDQLRVAGVRFTDDRGVTVKKHKPRKR